MAFKKHPELEGRHATLSASKYSWTNYDDDKFIESFMSGLAAAHGTRLHEFAKEAILLRVKMMKNGTTLNTYINDCVGFAMDPEVVVAANSDAFGTADAIKFEPYKAPVEGKVGLLRIFDLKTGVNDAKFRQLEVYAAYWCMDNGFLPGHIDFELRIYQNDEIRIITPEEFDTVNVINIIDRVQGFTDIMYRLRKEARFSA
jgi:hypothetical protein